MSDDKKNIGPEVETPTEAPAPGQPAPSKAEPIVTDPTPAEKVAPADKAEPTDPESPGSAAPEQPKPEKETQQTAIPGRGEPTPAFPGKVVDFAAAREEAGNVPLEIHHVNKVKNLKGKQLWELAMIAKKRKTLAVCKDCHHKIHHP